MQYPARSRCGSSLTKFSYSESVEFLYSANSFTLSTETIFIATIDRLSYFMLPQRLTQIRDLYFHWELDSVQYISLSYGTNADLSPWFNSWEALSKMTGLRRLHIVLSYRTEYANNEYRELWRVKGTELLKPIQSVTSPRDFVITLPDRRFSTSSIEVGTSRCVLRLPPMDEEDTDASDDDP